MSAEMLAGFAGVVLALALSYIPGLGKWFNAQASEVKVMINGLLLVLVAVGVYAGACAGLTNDFSWSLSCDRPSLVMLLGALLTALLSNQAAYVAFVKPFAGNNP